MAKKPSERWRLEPTSTAAQPDYVPSKSLPPRSSLERMANGDQLGPCPTCGNDRWWDNVGRKRMREMPATTPDYACTDCGHGRSLNGPDQPGRPGARRRPPTVIVSLPTTSTPTSVGRGGPQPCAALKADGSPCRNQAQTGDRFCGPHSGQTMSNQCQGTTKAGKPCGAGAQRGSRYCPQHQPRA